MKYYIRQDQYKASNVTFRRSPTIQAFSYGWWEFVAIKGGKVVFNTYPYSNTTRRHQLKVKRLMKELGITIDLEVSTKLSLMDADWLKDAKTELVIQRQGIEQAMLNGRKAKNEQHKVLIAKINHELNRLMEFENEVQS